MTHEEQKTEQDSLIASQEMLPQPIPRCETHHEVFRALREVPQPEVEGALDELTREMALRERCYPRWVTEGRLSKTDARDRLGRIKKAVEIVTLILDWLQADPYIPSEPNRTEGN